MWPELPPHLRATHLLSDEFVCVVRKGHPLAKGALTLEAYCRAGLGLVAGIEAAEHDFPVSALLVAALDREWDAASASEMMDSIIAHRHERVVGIGLDGPERAGPPARFESVYRRATQAGQKKTAHVCEDNQSLAGAPPSHLDACLDLLQCDRLDHGCNLMSSEAAIQRAKDSGSTLRFVALPALRPTETAAWPRSSACPPPA